MCNCQSSIEPPLRSFDRSKLRAIVFDDAASSWMVAHKQVFEAGVDASLLMEFPSSSPPIRD